MPHRGEPPYNEALNTQIELLKAAIGQSSHVDQALVLAALEFGLKAHKHQTRKNGDPYFIHPVRVALRATQYGLDTTTLIGALLHDVIEDTAYTWAAIEAQFGLLVAQMVEALTKVKTSKSLTLYKIFQLGNIDFRVILIKLLDRLDNLTDMQALPRRKQRSICQESLAIYAEVAHGLGLIEIEDEIKNLVFRQLYPVRYLATKDKLADFLTHRGLAVEGIVLAVQNALTPQVLNHLTWVKLGPEAYLYKSGDVDRLLAHIVVETKGVLDCYQALGMIHTNLRSVPMSIRDFISNPRANGWRGLTTKVMVFGEQVRIHIVSPEFAHQNRLGLIALIREGIYQSENYRQFFQLYLDVAGDENVRIDDVFRSSKARAIQCMTPKGDIIELRYGATILDFAFSVHSALGLRTLGGIVGGIRYGRNKILEDGMVVKVLSSEQVQAESVWINDLIMPKSRRELLRYLTRKKSST